MTRTTTSRDPLKRLPAEILTDIFLKALPDPFDALNPLSQLASITVPLYISHVCRVWRSFALSTGRLWSRLFLVYMLREGEAKGKRVVEIFDTWLERTRGAPLDYAFRCGLGRGIGAGYDVEPHGYYAEHIITRLLSQQFRWRNVEFHWNHINFSSDSPGLELTNMPMLESLSLSSNLGVFASIDLSRSPLLRMVDVDGWFSLVAGEAPLRYLRGPSRLRSWTPKMQSIPSCLDFLRVATFLTEFHADFPNAIEASYAGPHILLPNLRVLEVTGSLPPLLLRALTLPSLEALSLSSDVNGALLPFLNRSSPPLTFLDVTNSYADEITLLPVLRTLPTLKDLRIDIASVSRRLFRELAVTSKDTKYATASPVKEQVEQVICPRMETLHLRILFFEEDRATCVEAMIDMLKSRATIADSFKSICYSNGLHNSRDVVVSVSEMDDHAEELIHCFEEGWLIVGDYSTPFNIR